MSARVNRVALTVRRRHPVFPYEQTSAVRVGTSQIGEVSEDLSVQDIFVLPSVKHPEYGCASLAANRNSTWKIGLKN
jgi:hypothetical protein